MKLPSPINLFSYPPQKSAAALRKFLNISRYASSFSLRLARFLRRLFENILIGDGIKNIAPILAGLSIALGAGVLITYAAELGYKPLAPLPIGTGGAISNTYTLSSYLSGMIKLLIALGAATAVLFAIIGGTQYVASGIAPSAKQDAKNRITNAFIGLALMLTSYLLLNSINPELIGFNLELKKIKLAAQEIKTAGKVTKCVGGTQMGGMEAGGTEGMKKKGFTCTIATEGSTCYGKDENGEDNYECVSSKMVWPDDSDVRSKLAELPYDITVKRPNTCKTIGETACTSVYGLANFTISALKTLKKECGGSCVIKITGGTEYWLHGNKSLDLASSNATSHAPGGTAVDLEIDGVALDKYITTEGKKFTGAGCSAGTKYRIGTAIYVDESKSKAMTGRHWHVCYTY